MPATERFYYFTPTKYALEGVKNRRLKVAELEKANDPFEFLPVRCNKEAEEAILEVLNSLCPIRRSTLHFRAKTDDGQPTGF